MGELGRAEMKKALTLFLTALMLAEILAVLSPIPVGAPPDAWAQTDWSGGATKPTLESGTWDSTYNKYYENDNVYTAAAGEIELITSKLSGHLESSIFDAGSTADWGEMVWNAIVSTTVVGENNAVDTEPTTLVDGSSRLGVVTGGSLADAQSKDDVYENIVEENITDDYRLNWEHRITDVENTYENYEVIIYGYVGTDENVGIYIWRQSTSSWVYIDNLPGLAGGSIVYILPENINNYLVGDNFSVLYLENTADVTATAVHIDYCALEGTKPATTSVVVKTRTGTDDNPYDGGWNDWMKQDNNTEITSPDNRYIQYRVELLSENEAITPTFYDTTINYTVPPGQPVLYSPTDGTITNDNTPTFEWTVGANADNHRLLADNDADFSSPEENVLLGAIDNTYTPTTGLTDENYSWKVIAINAAGENESTAWTFLIDTVGPATPSLLDPADGAATNDNTITFRWTIVTDPSGVTYMVQVDNDPDFTSPEVDVSDIIENIYTPSELTDENYSWHVRAVDGANNTSEWSTVWTFIIDTVAPVPPDLRYPTDGLKTKDNTPTFVWGAIVDPSGVTYTIQVDNDADLSSPEVDISGLTDNVYTPSALADENYSWRVRAVDGAGNIGDWSSIWTLLIDTVPPAAPTLIWPADGENINENTPNLDWNAVSENSLPVTYDIWIDNDFDFSSPIVSATWITDDNYQVTTELAEGVWQWRVRAVDNVGNIGDNSQRSFRVDVTPPAAPTLLEPANGAKINDNTLTFRWTQVTDASGVAYTIQVDNDADFNSPEVNVSGLTENTYTPSALVDENYSWRVRAIDNAGNEGGWSSAWTLLIDTIPPDIPTLISPTDGMITNDNTPTFDWSDVAGAENYDLLVDNDADFSSPEIQVTVSLSTYTPTAGLADENYSWKVRARDAANNLSDWSTIWTFVIDTVLPGTPSPSSPADGMITTDNTPTFDWSDVAGAVEYSLQVDDDPNFSSPEINVLAANSTYTSTAELVDDNYSWRVQARDSANNWSPWSSIWTFLVAVRVRAVDVLVSPSWQENIAGGLLSYIVEVTNLGEVADNLNMSVSDTLGWDLSLDNTRFEDVENGGSRSTTLRVTIPSTALPSRTDNITVTVTSEGDPSKSDSENCQAHVALLRDVEVTISPSLQEGPPGETLLYIVTVKNTGQLDDKYNFVANDTLGWVLEISPTELWLGAGENDIASLSVTIPWETVSSITDVITVRAEGTLAEGTPTDPENVSAEAMAEARCTVVRSVSISISPSYQSGLPGTLLTYTVTVTNTGNAPDTYELTTSDNAGWSPIITPSSIALWPSASGNATLKVIVPSGAISCTRDNITVVAASQLDNTVSGSASCIAHAVRITSHAPIHIIGNDNFTQANGVISGSGTVDDPYIIGYWEIDASSTHGIWIENTDAYFIIRSCRIYGGGYESNRGVYFNQVKNGKIEGVTSYFNNVGIYFENSLNNLISKSDASNNFNGIHLQSSSNNRIEKCTTSNNFYYGTYLNSSDNNIISRCIAKNNTNGIYLQSSSNNKIIDNSNISNNGLSGIVVRFSSENNIVSNSIVENNYNGVYISDLSDNNCICNNSFKNNQVQAWDNRSNRWDNGYPSGGNYWSDYGGWDKYLGENQDIPGSDGIGDTPYDIPGGTNQDRYPLVTKGLELSISPSYKEGMPGKTLSYAITIVNTGNVIDNYAFEISDNSGWGPTITPSFLVVYPQNSENAILNVTIPDNAENCNRDEILVVARSQTDNTISDLDSCTAHAVIRGAKVSISPRYLSGLPGATLAYVVTIANTGMIDENYSLSTFDNSGWGLSVSPTSLSVQVGENDVATLTVTIPASASSFTEDNITVTAASQVDNTVRDNDTCIAEAIVRGIGVSISPDYQEGLPGSTLNYSVSVANTGETVDNFALSVSDNEGWGPALSENLLENVQIGENRIVTLSVTVPENAVPFTEDNIIVAAISLADPAASDSDSCIARVLAAYGVDVVISPYYQSTLPGTELSYTVTVTNIGTNVDNYGLTVSDNAGWALTLSENLFENIWPDENRTSTLIVTIPENAAPCTEDKVCVTATSMENAELSGSGWCIAHAVPSKAEFSLVTLYQVSLDVNLYLKEGSKLVVKFYTYENTFENESVIEEFPSLPWHVEENENVPHPDGIRVKRARLDLTGDNTENVISTIASFVVGRDDLWSRLMGIRGEWPYAGTSERDALWKEIMGIRGQWPYAPS